MTVLASPPLPTVDFPMVRVEDFFERLQAVNPFTDNHLGAGSDAVIGGQRVDAADLACHNLDTRLGRHHGIGSGPNTISTPLPELVQALLNQQGLVHDVLKQRDPERELERLWPKKPKALFFDRIFGHGS